MRERWIGSRGMDRGERPWALSAKRLALAAGVAALCSVSACSKSGGSGGASSERTAAPVGASGGYGDASSSDGGGGRYASADRYGRERGGSDGYGEAQGERPPAPMFNGEPMWSQTRAHSAQENAEYHFERAGADLGAKTLDEFLTKTHRFCDHPPAGTEVITRANGDRLLFDPGSGIFAVVTREGAPRTIFKPADGAAYWNEQKMREARGGDEGGYGRSGYGRRYGGYGQGNGADDRGGADARSDDRSGDAG